MYFALSRRYIVLTRIKIYQIQRRRGMEMDKILEKDGIPENIKDELKKCFFERIRLEHELRERLRIFEAVVDVMPT